MGCCASKAAAGAVQQPLPPSKVGPDRDRLAQLTQSLEQACSFPSGAEAADIPCPLPAADKVPVEVVQTSQVTRLLCEEEEEEEEEEQGSGSGDAGRGAIAKGPPAPSHAEEVGRHEPSRGTSALVSGFLMSVVGSSVAPPAGVSSAPEAPPATTPPLLGDPPRGVLASWLPMLSSMAPGSLAHPAGLASSRSLPSLPIPQGAEVGASSTVVLGSANQPPLIVKEINQNAWWRGVGVPVWLHIYDVSEGTLTWINNLIRPVGSGAFHAAVEVFDKEWSFGYSSGGSTGVYSCLPRSNTSHTYRESVLMGWTPLSSERVDKLVEDLALTWPGSSYTVLERNCCHFCDAMCRSLGVGPLPEWVTNLAGAGASIVEHVGRAAANSQVAAGIAVAKAGEYAGAAANLAGQKADELDERYQISSFLSQEIDEGKVVEAAQRLWSRASLVGACVKKPNGVVDRLAPAPIEVIETMASMDSSLDFHRKMKFEEASNPLHLDFSEDVVPISECATSGASGGSVASSGSGDSCPSGHASLAPVVCEEGIDSEMSEVIPPVPVNTIAITDSSDEKNAAFAIPNVTSSKRVDITGSVEKHVQASVAQEIDAPTTFETRETVTPLAGEEPGVWAAAVVEEVLREPLTPLADEESGDCGANVLEEVQSPAVQIDEGEVCPAGCADATDTPPPFVHQTHDGERSLNFVALSLESLSVAPALAANLNASDDSAELARDSLPQECVLEVIGTSGAVRTPCLEDPSPRSPTAGCHESLAVVPSNLSTHQSSLLMEIEC